MSERLTSRRGTLRLALAGLVLPLAGMLSGGVHAASLPLVAVWKDASCGCCAGWVQHMRDAGFSVTVRDVDDIVAVKQARGVPDTLWSCHTAVVSGYVVEGHVPADDIKRLLAEHPSAKGLASPGMPPSAPGMGEAGVPYKVVLYGTPAGDRVYAEH